MPHFPHVKALKLRNFKGIAKLDIKFDQSLTLLVGVNGVGKTSVLQALLAAVTRTWNIVPPRHYPLFDLPERVRRGDASDPEITIEVAVDNLTGEGRYVVKELNQNFVVENAISLSPIVKMISNLPLPLIVYYEQNRGTNSNISARTVSVSSQDNLRSSLSTTISSPLEFKTWFFDKEADEGQEIRERKNLEYQDSELLTIRSLLGHMDGFATVRSRKVSASRERDLFLEKDNINISFDSLSGGEQAFFLLIADLARRLMLAFPDRDYREAPAIVCIDEIELHLHPEWQRKILKILLKMFPACQFIVSTHSPQVVSSVKSQYVRPLKSGKDGVREVMSAVASEGRDSNFILKGVLDTPERDNAVSHLFDEFDRLVERGELEEAQNMVRRLDEAVEGGSPEVAIRLAKLNRLRQARK